MKKYILPFAVLLSLGFASCDDQLDLNPKDRVSESDYFNTESDLKLFTNPYYNNMLNKEPYDDQSDLVVCQNLSNEMRGGTFRSVPASGGGWTWTDLRRINTLLARVDRCNDEAAVVKYTALSRFFRAFFYFEKVKRFGDVPWYDKELGSADPDLYKSRDSREVVMTNMLADVDYAIANLPDEKTQTDVPYRATKWAAMALKAQFCLFEGTYRKYHGLTLEGHDYKYYLEQAVDAASQLMAGNKYKIYSNGNPNTTYLEMFRSENANSDEYILAIKFGSQTQTFHDAYGFSCVLSRGMPGYTRKFVNMYLMKDGTAFTDKPGWQEMTYAEEIKDRDPRLLQSIRYPGFTLNGSAIKPNLSESVTGYNPIKFVQDGITRSDNSTCDMPVYRYAEVLLNYAEAKAELGTLTQEDLDKSVNLLRDRVGMAHLIMSYANANPDRYLSDPETGYSNVEGANKGVILEIRRERAVELAQEGFRWNDLMRWKAGKCTEQSLTGMYFPGPGEYDFDGDGEADIVLYAAGQSKPTAADGVPVYQIGSDVFLSGGDKGYTDYHYNIGHVFNEDRDYLYPIPTDEISLYKEKNPDFAQNPGWN
ncbi:MAG: RagB/SusD family nutrient uptake outer membrane protein [Muribaculum sp.]|nr:RagB/SusD family nutrient uptake outer membrane protein [Muribaculum sp.]